MEKITETILKFLRLDNLVNNLTGYVEARIALMKVEIREDIAKAIGRVMVMLGLFLMGFMFFLFLSLGLALFLNTYFDDAYMGYWIVAGIYGLICLLLFVMRNQIYHYFEEHFADMIKRKEK